ncbi:MAG: DUF1800 domain-containing protein [Tahibacter sp.]
MMAAAARRSFVAQALSLASVPSPLPLPTPEPPVLLLNRISFGIAGPELQRAGSIGVQAYVDEQLDYRSLDDSTLETRLATRLPTLALSNAQLIDGYARNDDNTVRRQPLLELQTATLARAIFSPRQLFEVMVEFWSNHFNVTHTEGPARYYKTVDDREVIRAHALGKFSELLRGSAQSPAMLHYLNNDTNIVDGPNENYARELMELHTLGVGGGYSESDVREVARCFTGWSIDHRPGQSTFRFYPARHDFGAKLVLGQSLAAGQGLADGLAVLDLLARHPATAAAIATKLVRRFVADTPLPELVKRAAETFASTEGDIAAVLRVILTSAEFITSADAKFKRPIELLVSLLRGTAARLDGEDWVRRLEAQLSNLGQVPLYWPAPNGYPDVQGYWLNTSALLARWNLSSALLENRLSPAIAVDVAQLAGGARTPRELVDSLSARLLRRPLSERDRRTVIDFAADGGADDSTLSGSSLQQARRDVASLLLASAYFQYR